MGRNIIDDFADLDTEGPDLDLDEEGEGEADALFSETTEMAHELDDDELQDLDREYHERRNQILASRGLPIEKEAKGSKGSSASKDDFEWKPANTLDAPEPRPGLVQRWIRFMVGEKDDPKNWSRAKREGWTPRPVDSVPQGYDAPTMNHGVLGTVIQVGDVILCEMDERLYKSRQKFFRQKAARQKEAMEKRPMLGTPIRVEERKATVSYGRRRAQATED